MSIFYSNTAVFPIAPLMGYSPASDRERLVLHICKGGVVDRVVDQLYGKRVHRTLSVTYAWDDGTGKVIAPLAPIFAKAKNICVVSDISPYGLVALNNVSALLNKVGARWRYLGITDQWFRIIPKSQRESWIDSRRIPLPGEMQHITSTRFMKTLKANQLGDRCQSIIESGYVLELEAFLCPNLRSALRRILRSI